MTREEIEREYVTRDGIIKSPGKFEGEPVWVPWLYDLWMEGSYSDKEGGNQEEGTIAWAAFVVTDEMIDAFPTLAGTCSVCGVALERPHTEAGLIHSGDESDTHKPVPNVYAVGIEEADSGFIYSQELSEAEYNKLEG